MNCISEAGPATLWHVFFRTHF